MSKIKNMISSLINIIQVLISAPEIEQGWTNRFILLFLPSSLLEQTLFIFFQIKTDNFSLIFRPVI